MKLISRQVRGAMTQELTGLQFYNQRKSGEEEKNFFVFLSKHNASIIYSSSRLGRAVLCPYVVKLGLQTVVFCVSIEHVLGTIKLLSSLAGCGSHATSVLLFWGITHSCAAWLVAKRACLVLWLSEPVF